MARADQCDGCGTELSPDSRYCVKCGRTRAAPVLHLERLAVDPVGGRAVERTVAEQPGPRPPRRRSLLAIGALAVAVIGAVVMLSGGGSVDDDARSPSTTQPGASTTRPPRRTTTTTWQPSVIVGQVGAGDRAPVLGAPTGGLSLYAVSGLDLVRVELDTGAITVRRRAIERGFSNSFNSAAMVIDGRLVVVRDGRVFVSPMDLAADPVSLDDVRFEGGLSQDRLIVTAQWPASSAERVEVHEFDPDGGVVSSWTLPPQAWAAGVIGDRVVAQSAGRIYLVGPDGDVEPFAAGEPVHVSGPYLLWRHCDDELQCSLTLADLERGTSLDVPNLPRAEFWFVGRSIAPDGRFVAVMVDQRVRLVELATGAELAQLDGATQPAWSPDGSWVFTSYDEDSLVALSTRGDAPIVIHLPAGFDIRASDVVLAVG